MVKDLKFGKRFIAGVLALSLVGVSMGSFHVQKKNDYNRVKGYLEDFLTEDNYVDLSKVSRLYKIENFDGDVLKEVLEDTDIDYVRITDSFIDKDENGGPYKVMSAINYDDILFTSDDGTVYYNMYEPMRSVDDSKVIYSIPNGFTLIETLDNSKPIGLDDLDNAEVKVIENDYEESYSLVLERKK